MSADPFRLILRRLESNPPVVQSRELGTALDPLVGLGLLRQAEPATSVPCGECGDSGLLPITYIRDEVDGQMHGYTACAHCGVNAVGASSIHRWNIDVHAVLEKTLAGCDNVQLDVIEIIPGRLWAAGRTSWPGRSQELYFARGYRRGRDDAVVDMLRRRPKTVLLMPTEAAVVRWGDATDNVVISLEGVARLTDGGIELSRDLLESRFATTKQRPSPPKPRRRSSRAVNIERLEKELITHLRAARDHAVMTRDLSGEALLLDRPTKEQLGKQAGVSSSSVTRCFQDEAGEKLRYLWDLAADRDRIVGYRGN